MAVKLYYGGFGDYKTFTVAESEQKAIESIGKKISAPFLPVTVEEISEVDGYRVNAQDKSTQAEIQITGETSDGYHTFNELYHHRAVLFSVICNDRPELAWKSLKHDTGDMYEGMFIVGIETPEGQATYHYDIDPYWDMFEVKELPNAPRWDGHTPADAISRVRNIGRMTPMFATLPEAVEASIKVEVPLRQCKKCDFACENQGELLAHYREKHPKGD